MTSWVRTPLGDLASEHHDLLVIGGGITGAGIARDAALRGLSVALVEAGDFGSGTSSRSSRLIHGGLRYLEQGRIHLVAESLRERALLLRLAPHLVRPLGFVLPFFRGDRVPAWKIRLGLTLYDLLAGRGNVPRHHTLGKQALLDLEPMLRERGLTGGAQYYDAQCDDARLTLAVIRAAAGQGARVANYVRATELIEDNSRIGGARVRDELTGAEAAVHARLVVNATGPWTDTLRRMADPAALPALRPTKGSHVQVRRSRLGNRQAVFFTSPLDRRPMFVLPWGEWAYIGTTDTDTTEAPEEIRASAADVEYLLRSANSLFPDAHLGLEDVVATWSGLRPLLATERPSPASLLSREHRILPGPAGMLTIAGGKLTTFRRMAADVVDRAAKELGIGTKDARERSETEPLPGGETSTNTGFRTAGLELGLSEATVDLLLRHYGSETPALYTICRQRPELAGPLHPEHPAIGAQVVFAAQQEFACTVADILERRVRLATETLDHGAGARATVERLLSGYFSSL